MRLLYVINSFNCGGAEKLVSDLSRSVAKSCDYVGVAALYKMNNSMEEKMQKQLNDCGVETYILDKGVGKDRFSSAFKLAKIAKSVKADIIHGHCSVPMLIAKMAGLFTNTPVVSTIHNTRGYSWKKEKLTDWMSCHYVSIGRAAEEYMIDSLKIPQKKITRIYNAVDTEKFKPLEKIPGFWEKIGFNPDLPVIINVGRVTAQKNQLCLMKALNECLKCGKPMQCAVLGSYSEDDKIYKELKNYIDENGLTKYVKFLDQVENVEIFLNNADIFVMTSIYEGLSVSFLEAVLCKLPVAVTDMPFVTELNEISDCSYVVKQNDYLALSKYLAGRKYKNVSDAAYEIFSQRFSMDGFARQHMVLYEKILDKRRV